MTIAMYSLALVFLEIDLLFQILLRDPKAPRAIPILLLISGVAEPDGFVRVPRYTKEPHALVSLPSQVATLINSTVSELLPLRRGSLPRSMQPS